MTDDTPIPISPERLLGEVVHKARGYVGTVHNRMRALQSNRPDDDELMKLAGELLSRGSECLTQIETLRGKAMAKDLTFVVVDDDPDAVEALRSIIEDQLYFDVIGSAATGPDMVKTVLEKKPNMVVFDIRLPGFDGLTAFERIWETYPVPGVVITGYDDRDVVRRMKKKFALGYVVKPVQFVTEVERQIDLAWEAKEEIEKLRVEVTDGKAALENRKKLEKAKDILCDQYGWAPGYAFRMIQANASRRNLKLHELAEKVIEGKPVIDLEKK